MAMGIDWLVLRNQAAALCWNLLAWLLSLLPRFLQRQPAPPRDRGMVCVSVPGPGGVDKLVLRDLPRATVGYNVPGIPPPLVRGDAVLPDDCVIVKIAFFSINYADIAIRWGLYESALRFVGWPIVPGFDFSGTVVEAGPASGLAEGDEVFGVSMFGTYSNRVLVPGRQLRKRPPALSPPDAAALPAVGGTALHALSLAGFWPSQPLSRGRGVLIHSAAGGVGSMLIQMCKLAGCTPIVAVVRGAHKVDPCRQLGADVVIDKGVSNLWREAKRACPGGYAAVFDANGVETLAESYAHLALCGRLIVYGYHTNIPRGRSVLSPWQWAKMALGVLRMPRFDAMDMTLTSKAVLGFNLSFFAEEEGVLNAYMAQLSDWVVAGKLRLASVRTFDMADVGAAHELLQTGTAVGKIVIRASDKKSE